MSDRDTTFDAAEKDGATGVRRSRKELYRERFDRFVLTPVRIAWSDWRTRIGSLIVLAYVFVGTIGVHLIEEPTQSMAAPTRAPPLTDGYLLGTNDLGEGLLAKLVMATPPMLQMILAGAVFSTIIATALGTVSGYKGGVTDTVITTITDIAMTIPGLPLIIVILVLFEPKSPYIIGVILAINAWAGLARQIRSQVLELRDRSYVEASRIMNRPLHAIILDDILPNIMPFVLISFVNTARGVIFGSVALFYLGVLPVDFANWGIMLNKAYSGGSIYAWDAIYWITFPMAAIVFLSFGLVLISQGTERLFNPRIRARHADTIEETAPTEM